MNEEESPAVGESNSSRRLIVLVALASIAVGMLFGVLFISLTRDKEIPLVSESGERGNRSTSEPIDASGDALASGGLALATLDRIDMSVLDSRLASADIVAPS